MDKDILNRHSYIQQCTHFLFLGKTQNFYMLSLKILININIVYENLPSVKSVKLSKLNTLLSALFLHEEIQVKL